MKAWKHIFKLDPAKEISNNHLQLICQSDTDAIIIGGTDNVTLENTTNLLYRVKQFDVPCILEISTMESITLGFDYYFIPMVMNSKEKKWMMDIHHEAMKRFGNLMDWETILFEGYCILNEKSKAFQKTNCKTPHSDDVIAYAQMAEQIFKLPVFYLEYSGTYGDPHLVKKVKTQLNSTLLFYGGGITTAFEAIEMKQYADVIIVGNSIYTHFKEALQTVKAIK